MNFHQTQFEKLETYKEKLGFDPSTIEQGSSDWLKMKLGVISASNAKYLLGKRTADGRATYMASLIAQVCTGVSPELSAKPLQWGKDNEQSARSAYEFEKDESVLTLPFIYAHDYRVGCSPDFLSVTTKSGGELKCPFNSENHIKFLCFDDVKKEYYAQVQFSLWVTGADFWAFGSYDPRMKKNQLATTIFEPDTAMFERFLEETSYFIAEMDEKLERLEVKFGDQWAMVTV